MEIKRGFDGTEKEFYQKGEWILVDGEAFIAVDYLNQDGKVNCHVIHIQNAISLKTPFPYYKMEKYQWMCMSADFSNMLKCEPS
jgi:hypothetical protein